MAFDDWLQHQLDRRNWSSAHLAAALGVSRSTVSRWLGARRVPEPAACERMALVLGVPVDVVLREAGHHAQRDDVETELRSRIQGLVDHYARLVDELEETDSRLERARQELSVMQVEQSESPIEAALAAVRDMDLPEPLRFELEQRLAAALWGFEPRWWARNLGGPVNWNAPRGARSARTSSRRAVGSASDKQT